MRSGHKVSKSNSAAGLALWWVTCFEDAQAILTSASARQVRAILWREIRVLYRKSRYPLGGDLRDLPELGLQFADGRQIVGFSTKEPERFSGISGSRLLFILDEASGIDEPIYEALEGNRAGGARVLLAGNPTRTSGTFYDAFHEKRSLWKTLHISSEESPNVREGRMVIPGLATREWVEERREEWGQESPLFDVRVAGNFPRQGENAIAAVELVEAATDRWDDTPADGRLDLGVDVAWMGDDDSVIFPRRGNKALTPTIVHGHDTVQVAGKVREVAAHQRVPDEKPRVKVDVIGFGAGVYDMLKSDESLEVVPITVSESPTAQPDEGPGFAMLRDQLWFGVRDWMRAGGAIPDDVKLHAELVAPTYSFDNRGRIKVEAKDKIKARIHRSPDRADALALSVYEGGGLRYGIDFGIS